MEERPNACGRHEPDELRALKCAGWFDGKFEPEFWRRCDKASVIVFEVKDDHVYNVDGHTYKMKNGLVGSCEEHEARRRLQYQLTGPWDIVREFPASELKAGG